MPHRQAVPLKQSHYGHRIGRPEGNCSKMRPGGSKSLQSFKAAGKGNRRCKLASGTELGLDELNLVAYYHLFEQDALHTEDLDRE